MPTCRHDIHDINHPCRKRRNKCSVFSTPPQWCFTCRRRQYSCCSPTYEPSPTAEVYQSSAAQRHFGVSAAPEPTQSRADPPPAHTTDTLSDANDDASGKGRTSWSISSSASPASAGSYAADGEGSGLGCGGERSAALGERPDTAAAIASSASCASACSTRALVRRQREQAQATAAHLKRREALLPPAEATRAHPGTKRCLSASRWSDESGGGGARQRSGRDVGGRARGRGVGLRPV
eukprot:COSAG04_NODE_10191_length_797_cov_1.252149_1_plen_236_part_01